MFKMIATTVLGCSGLVCCAGDALACGGGSCAMAMPVASAPTMPGMPGMAMPAAPQASAGLAYRTYSYQPGPAPGYRPSMRRSGAASGYHDAGWKARGGF